MPTISIAMAAYNGALFLREQLDSLAAQTLQPLEVVITDDGSTDGTEAVVRAFAAEAPFPVSYHRNPERLGYRRNFMRAAALCRGEWIAFCDQDDIWRADKLEKVAAAITGDVAMVFHNAAIWRDGAEVGELYPFAGPPDRRVEPFFAPNGFTITYDARLNRAEGLHPLSRDCNDSRSLEAHDQWIAFLAESVGSVRFLSDKLVRYRQHAGNVVGWHLNQRFRRALWMVSSLHHRTQERFLSARRRRCILGKLLDDPAFADRAGAIRAALADLDRFAAVETERRRLYSYRGVGRRLKAFGRTAATVRAGSDDAVPAFTRGAGLMFDFLVGVPFGGLLARRSKARRHRRPLMR